MPGPDNGGVSYLKLSEPARRLEVENNKVGLAPTQDFCYTVVSRYDSISFTALLYLSREVERAWISVSSGTVLILLQQRVKNVVMVESRLRPRLG